MTSIEDISPLCLYSLPSRRRHHSCTGWHHSVCSVEPNGNRRWCINVFPTHTTVYLMMPFCWDMAPRYWLSDSLCFKGT
jgi:hypothetical protein